MQRQLRVLQWQCWPAWRGLGGVLEGSWRGLGGVLALWLFLDLLALEEAGARAPCPRCGPYSGVERREQGDAGRSGGAAEWRSGENGGAEL